MKPYDLKLYVDKDPAALYLFFIKHTLQCFRSQLSQLDNVPTYFRNVIQTCMYVSLQKCTANMKKGNCQKIFYFSDKGG